MEDRGSPGNRQQALLRIATFNLESLDESPRLAQRIACLRQQLTALEADATEPPIGSFHAPIVAAFDFSR